MNDMGYRGPIPPSFFGTDRASTKDESDYSTLFSVQKILNDSLDQLKHDFNAFEVLEQPDPWLSAQDMLVDVRARKQMHSFISNLKLTVDSAIERVDAKNNKE